MLLSPVQTHPLRPRDLTTLIRLQRERSRLASWVRDHGHCPHPGPESQVLVSNLQRTAARVSEHLCLYLEPHPVRPCTPVPRASPLFWPSRFLEACWLYRGRIYAWIPAPSPCADVKGPQGHWALYEVAAGSPAPFTANFTLSLMALFPEDGSGAALHMTRPMSLYSPASAEAAGATCPSLGQLSGHRLLWGGQSVDVPKAVSMTALLAAHRAGLPTAGDELP